MKKIIRWFKAHKPSKRKLIQLYAALLFNANLKGFSTGNIYKGPLKNVCTPGLNCYSCPGASGACPLGALQNSLASSGKTAPYYVFGIIMLYGLLFGRWICGFLCPFGLIQEFFHKIPTPKLKKNKVTRILSYLKYVILVFFVFIIPIAYAFRNFPLPGFCKYICPAGTLEGAMGLLSNRVNEGYLRMLGPLFTWKFLLMVSILTACIFIFRFFCRFLCPLGALYGLFNKISLVGVKVDHSSCTDCGLCVGKCKMDIKHVGDAECINCGECISACPTKAISWKGSKIFLAPNEIPDPAEDRAKAEETAKKIKKRNTIIKSIVAILLIAALCGTLVYYNFIDGRDTSPLVPPVESTETTSDDGTAETTDDQPPKAPVGTAIGNTCPEILVDLVGSDDKFNVQAINSEGRAVVLNFWYTTCGPCLEELPYFYEVANDYEDQIDVIAIHIDQPNVDVTDFIANDSGHPEWSDGTMLIGWDTNMRYVNMFNIQACPVTIVINADGVITDKFVGGLTQDELIAAVEKALAH
ncbi:MAG: redoxin family protein [Clostridia bacterium]|nr:redoxin family protein [Clostridia bacterium]